MKRKQLIKHLKTNGCEFEREGGNHSWWFNRPLIAKINNKPTYCEIHDEKTSYYIPLNEFTNIFSNEFNDRDIIIKNKDELIEPVKKFLNESLEKNI